MRFCKCTRSRVRASFRTTLAFAVLSCFCSAQARSQQDKPESVRWTKADRKWVEQTLKMLSLEEKVGKMWQVRYYAASKHSDTKENHRLRDEWPKSHTGYSTFGCHSTRPGRWRCSPRAGPKARTQSQT